MSLDGGLVDEGVWFRVEDPSAVSAVRRAAERLGNQVGLPGNRLGALAIVAAELASNLAKHADEGRVLVRPVRDGGVAGVELVAVDSGPGMDMDRSARDGHSTAGTLGIGLGAITRQATWLDTFSAVGKGTVTAAQVWPDQAPAPVWAAGISRAMTGEDVCGDGYAIRTAEGRRQVLVCDGLGHGPLAAAATAACVRAFHLAPAAGPAAVVEHLHKAVSHTRGAALAVAELAGDDAKTEVRYAGLGNIAASIVDGAERRGLVSLPGIAGHQRRDGTRVHVPPGRRRLSRHAFRRRGRPLEVRRVPRAATPFDAGDLGDDPARRGGAP